jgi:hypothetical protein
MSKVILAIVVWILGWIPISLYFFHSNPHFPSALAAPVLGFFGFGRKDFFDSRSNFYNQVSLPFIVFWCGLILSFACGWIISRFITRRKVAIDESAHS